MSLAGGSSCRVWLACAAVSVASIGDCGGGAKAVAEITELGDSGVSGTVEFMPMAGDKIRVIVRLKGLTPGPHGFHIHEYGDCSDPEGKSAGRHFNPEAVVHGSPSAPLHHAGDLGNVRADADGRGNMTLETQGLTLDAGRRGVVGRAVIIHEWRDDLMSQPTGASGDRIACGVIQATTGESEPVLPHRI